MNSGGVSFTTPVQQLVMQNAKCRQFKGVREDWDPWSLEWLEFAQVMQGSRELKTPWPSVTC